MGVTVFGDMWALERAWQNVFENSIVNYKTNKKRSACIRGNISSAASRFLESACLLCLHLGVGVTLTQNVNFKGNTQITIADSKVL